MSTSNVLSRAARVRSCTRLAWCILIGASLAIILAQSEAGSWNDGSRLAVVDSLVDRGTLAIDDSVFVRPDTVQPGAPSPYAAAPDTLRRFGTQDKLQVNGRFFSDKPMVPQLYLASWYLVLQRTVGLSAAEHADWFCYVMTLASSGVALVLFILAGTSVTGQVLGESRRGLALFTCVALGGCAMAYFRTVNAHGQALGLLMAAIWALTRWCETIRVRDGCPSPRPRLGLSLILGGLCGALYATDVAVGGLFMLCIAPLILWHCVRRDLWTIAIVGLAACPAMAAHHWLNYEIGGTFRPANSVPEHLQWAGSPFTADRMTGRWNHPHQAKAALYAAELLIGKKGFLLLNLPLMFAVCGVPRLLKDRGPHRAEVLSLSVFCVLVWLLFACLSVNHSGQCASIRWFVPLIAPGTFLTAMVLRQRPELWRSFLAISFWAALMGLLMTAKGPWTARMVPGQWVWLACTGITWLWIQKRPARDGRLRPGEFSIAARV